MSASFRHVLPSERLGTKHESFSDFQAAVAADDPPATATTTTTKAYTLIVVTTPSQGILLGQKHRGFGAGMINSFGGKVEVGETPAAGAVRELHEETGIQIPKVECMEDATVGTLHFTFEDSHKAMVVHLFRIVVGFSSEHETQPTTVLLPDRSSIRGCDEISPVWYDDWHEIPLDNMFADDSLWLTTLLLASGQDISDDETTRTLIDGWFHFRPGGQDVNTIAHHYMDVRRRQRQQQQRNGTYTMERRLFHALHQSGVNTPDIKEFKEAFAFLNAVRSAFRKSKQSFDLVIDVAGGHGALGALFLLTTTIPQAVVIDPARVGSVRKAWEPFLQHKELRFRHECLRTGLPAEIENALQEKNIPPSRILVVACHACQHLSDETLAIATAFGVHAAAMPCCQRDTSPGGSWKATSKNLGLPVAVTMDLLLAGKYMGVPGYDVRMKSIDGSITPQNRIILCKKTTVVGNSTAATTRNDAAHEKLLKVYERAHHEAKRTPQPMEQHGASTSRRSLLVGFVCAGAMILLARGFGGKGKN